MFCADDQIVLPIGEFMTQGAFSYCQTCEKLIIKLSFCHLRGDSKTPGKTFKHSFRCQ